MFKKKTLFIVGAGASKELDLPMGDELKGRIGKAVGFTFPDGFNPTDGNQAVYWAVQEHLKQLEVRDSNPWWRAGQAIKAAMPQAISIDNFIHTHSEDDKIIFMGKLGIAVCILEAERASFLRGDRDRDGKLNFGSLKESWHATFVKILLENAPANGIDTLFDNVSFITFNYDRCIEHYLEKALQNYLLISEQEAQKAVNKLTVIHPYGQVGRLPWQPCGRVKFGAEPHATDLLEIAKQIRTFTERVEDEDMMDRIHVLLNQAEQVIYLGFSYGAMNLELLTTPAKSTKSKLVLGTSIGISDANRSVIADEIKASLGVETEIVRKIDLPPMTCNQLLHDYWRVIAR